jgi:hypothetical protein
LRKQFNGKCMVGVPYFEQQMSLCLIPLILSALLADYRFNQRGAVKICMGLLSYFGLKN